MGERQVEKEWQGGGGGVGDTGREGRNKGRGWGIVNGDVGRGWEIGGVMGEEEAGGGSEGRDGKNCKGEGEGEGRGRRGGDNVEGRGGWGGGRGKKGGKQVGTKSGEAAKGAGSGRGVSGGVGGGKQEELVIGAG